MYRVLNILVLFLSKQICMSSYFLPLPDGPVDRLSRWEERWSTDYNGKPGFHLETVNPSLEKYSGTSLFTPPKDKPLLVPLCGKSLDMVWLANNGGYNVIIGVEGVPQAIEEMKAESLPSLTKKVVKYKDGSSHKETSIWTTAAVEGDEWFNADREKPKDGDVPSSSSSSARDGGTISIICTDFFELSNAIFTARHDDDKPRDDDDNNNNNPPIIMGGIYDRGALVAIPPSARKDYVSTLDSLLQPGGQILLITLDRSDDKGPPFRVTPGDVEELFVPMNYDVRLLEEHDTEVKGMPSSEYVFVLTKIGENECKGPSDIIE